MVEIREAPVPVRYWHSWSDNGHYTAGIVKNPTVRDVSLWFRRGYNGAIKILLSNNQTLIVRAKK